MSGIVLDTETTGLNEPQVIELAYQEIDQDLNPLVGALHCKRFMPSKDIEAGAFRVHGISKNQLVDMPASQNLLRELPKILSTTYIIGHRIEYDVNAINVSTNKKIEFKTICTKRLAYEVYDSQRSWSLVNLCTEMGLVDESLSNKAHSADSDVIMTTRLLTHLVKTLSARTGRIYTLDTLYDYCNSLHPMRYEDYKRKE